MKIKPIFSTILFYIISAVCLSILIMGFSSPISSLIVLIVFSLSLYFGSFYLQKDNQKTAQKIMKYTFITLFAVYVVFILSLLFTNTYFGRDEIFETRFNLIPFKTISLFITSANKHTLPYSSIITNLLGNFIAFMPFSFYLPLFFKSFRKVKIFLPAIILIVAVIEAFQLILKCGSCDIDDLILNVIGATGLYLILKSKKVLPIIKNIVKF